MIIVAYLSDDFVIDTLSLGCEKLRYFLSKLFEINENIILLEQKKSNLKKILSNPPKNSSPDNLVQWIKFIKDLKSKGKIIDKYNDFILKNFSKNKHYGELNQEEFYLQKSLKEKVFNLTLRSNKKIKSLPTFGENLDAITFNIDKLIKNNEKTILKLNDSDRENLFFDKLAGFCYFFNTFLLIDPYIIEHKKNKEPSRHLKKIISWLNGSNIERVIVLTKDPYAELTSPNNKINYHDKKKSIINLRKNLEWIIKDNRVLKNIDLFLCMPNIFKSIHDRYCGWYNLDQNESSTNFTSLNSVKNKIEIALLLGRGDGYFSDDLHNFNATFKYESSDTLNQIIIFNILQLEPSKRIESERRYWEENHHIKDRFWMHMNEVFQNKATKRGSLKSI